MRTSAGMDDATLLRRALDGLAAQTRLVAASAGTLHEQDGWIACVLPHAPLSSLLNCVVGAPDVETAAALYARAGVRKWGVWLPADDVESARRLERQGLVLDSTPVLMGAALADLELDGAPATHPIAMRTMGAINDQAYGYTDGRLEQAIAPLPPDAVDAHALDVDGAPVAVTYLLDVGEDATVGWVATLPHARRRGLATGVLTAALRRAQGRGITTTTLWASAMGARVYERMGYRPLGHLHLWEQRP